MKGDFERERSTEKRGKAAGLFVSKFRGAVDLPAQPIGLCEKLRLRVQVDPTFELGIGDGLFRRTRAPGRVHPLGAHRAEHVELERVLERLGLVREARGNVEHLAWRPPARCAGYR